MVVDLTVDVRGIGDPLLATKGGKMRLTHLCEEADNNPEPCERELTPAERMPVGYEPGWETFEDWETGTWEFVCEVCGLTITVDIG